MRRDLKYLTPEARFKCQEHIRRCKDVGIDVIVINTLRYRDEQAALHAQGRNSLNLVNELRLLVGWPIITAHENTYTVTDASPGTSNHEEKTPGAGSTAWDVVIVFEGEVVWDTTVDFNKNKERDYLEIGAKAKELGLEWGHDLKSGDYGHLQLPETTSGQSA